MTIFTVYILDDTLGALIQSHAVLCIQTYSKHWIRTKPLHVGKWRTYRRRLEYNLCNEQPKLIRLACLQKLEILREETSILNITHFSNGKGPPSVLHLFCRISKPFSSGENGKSSFHFRKLSVIRSLLNVKKIFHPFTKASCAPLKTCICYYHFHVANPHVKTINQTEAKRFKKTRTEKGNGSIRLRFIFL